MSDLESFYIDIHCVDLIELVTEYLDAALSPSDVRRFDDHVADCDECRIYIDQIKMTVTLIGTSNRGADGHDIEWPGNFDELLHLFSQLHR